MRRRSLLTLGMFSSLAMLSFGGALTACEDGPNQTFSPAGPNAGNYWNNGNPDAAVGTATGEYDANFGAKTPLNLCTADQQRVAWANMLSQPIIPGNYLNELHPTFAGLDLAGPDWAGETYENAEATLCSGIDTGLGSDGITPVEGACFGDNCEVAFNYVPATHIIGQLDLSLGYTGAADFFSDPVQFPGVIHKYHMVIGQEVQKDNQPFPLDWSDPHLDSLMEVYFGQMFTYGGGVGNPGSPGCPTLADAEAGKCPYQSGNVWNGPGNTKSASAYTYRPGYLCSSDDSCLLYGPNIAPSLGGDCYFGIRPLLSYWNFSCNVPTQPSVSTVDHFYYDFGKVLPTSHLAQDLRISATGPTTHARPGTNDPPTCNQFVGIEFNNFLSTCLTQAVTRSGVEWEKLVGGATHDVENIYFNLVGINMSWTEESLETGPGPNGSHAVVQDKDTPVMGDLATDWEFDVRTDALADNDNPQIQNAPDGATSNQFRGSGLIQRQWALLVQADMNSILAAANPTKAAFYTHFIGDPACRVPAAQAQALGCTGFEGFAINGMPEPTDNNLVGGIGVAGGDGCTTPTYTGGSCAGAPCFGNICDNISIAGSFAANNLGYGGYGSSVLVPGDPTSYFCVDPAQAPALAGGCVDGPVWTNALQFVINTVGLGNPKILPQTLQDRRYYFRWWGIALIQYLEAYGVKPAPWGTTGFVTAADVANQGLDLTSLFFDNNYGAGFDKNEYIDRSTMSATAIGPVPTPGGTITIPAKNDIGGPAPASIAMDFNYGTDTIAANQRYSDWYRRMDREEAAMFAAMLVDKSTLPGSENTVNITNLGGSILLNTNYTSYECATQWPNVTIIGNGTAAKPMIDNQPWASVCQETCPAFPQIYPNPCPFPPGVGASGTGTPELDQNGALAGCGTKKTGPGCKGYSGATIYAQNRLAAYPAVWGGTGAWCPDSGKCTGGYDKTTGACLAGDTEGDSYANGNDCNTTETKLGAGGACANPYGAVSGQNGGCIFASVPNSHGSVFQVGSHDSNNARLTYTPYTYNGTTYASGTNLELQTAYVSLPNMASPFNNNTDTGVSGGTTPPKAGATGSIVVTVPWTPSVEGIGFTIPTSGTTGKFVQTAQLDFTGVLETYLFDVVPWVDPVTNVTDPMSVQIEAIEGDDYLGEVFLCQDNGAVGGTAGDSFGTQDLLGVHMYDSGGAVLEWLTAHPGTQDSCNMIVQYSQYDNYLDVIASISAGVVVYIAQGSGYGRITDVQLFDPAIAAIP